jgi:hypothetical protein
MKHLFILLVLLSKSILSQIAPNEQFDTLKESIKVNTRDYYTMCSISADHHYCTENNKDFSCAYGFEKSFWPFKMEDDVNKKLQLRFDHINFFKKIIYRYCILQNDR